jgi:tetratricopeptide (TPR) repeat protein
LLAEGNAMLELGRLKDAIDLFTRSLTTYTFTGEMRGIILCRMNIGLCQVRLGFMEEAFLDFERLEHELENLQTPRLQAFLFLYHGMAHEAAGNFAAARRYYERALQARRESGLTAMSGDDLAGVLRASIGQGEGIEPALEALQTWWRTNDPRALEDPLLVMYSLVQAYEVLGNERLMNITLNEGARFFLDRANQIQNPAIREVYLRGKVSGKLLLAKAKEAGLVQL